MATTTNLYKLIEKLSTEQMRTLNSIIVTKLRAERAIKEQLALSNLKTGDKVWFDSGRRGVIRGKITAFKRKNVIIQPDNSYQTWRVTPTLLHKVA